RHGGRRHHRHREGGNPHPSGRFRAYPGGRKALARRHARDLDVAHRDLDPGQDDVLARRQPRTRGIMIMSHGLGISPTGTWISAGRFSASASVTARSSSGAVVARNAAAPKLSANLTKSGLVRLSAMSRPPNRSFWIMRTLPNAA